MPQLWEEIRRRNLHRVTAAYAVVAWVLVQGAGIVFPAFELPAWTLRFLIILLIAGAPVLWISLWLTHPQTPAAVGAAAQSPLKRGEIVLIGLLGLVLLVSAGELVMPLFRQGAPPAAAPSPAANATDASIAVLPFENLSSDKDAGYFAAGIQDEILTRLTKIGALKVISRTSTAQYASRPDNLRAIARQLGVANILEGSVQRAGNSVHINVQLIQAASDTHLWAEVYDRKLDDIFGVEGEVATAIAEALKAKVTGDEKEVLAA